MTEKNVREKLLVGEFYNCFDPDLSTKCQEFKKWLRRFERLPLAYILFHFFIL